MNKDNISGLLTKHLALNEEVCHVADDIESYLKKNLKPINPAKFEEIPNNCGLYLFCYNEKIFEIEALWEAHLKNCANASPFNKSKSKKCKSIDGVGGFPMYIGKSEELKKRIKEHWNLPCDSTTKSMRLEIFLQKNSFDTSRISLSYIDLSEFGMTAKTYYVTSALERLLKDKMNPFIGR
ncbi:hypothetical protein [Fibrobacter sp.]|uniref:hypothetical protein n=1 Tax=Fibrobacter sp. TaxID=35828 RepID=UPI00386A5732